MRPHLFTVDVEEHFQVHAFEDAVSRDDWDSLPSRVENSTARLLDLLARRGARGTFFVLGWVADRKPHLIRRIAAAGHEVASHGWWHRRVTRMSPAEFREDIANSRKLLEDITGGPVVGFRAPSFSLVPGTEWAFDVLLEEGFRYDSSIFPVRRLTYGYPGACREPHLVERASGTLLELPMATLDLGGLRLPAAGGAYFRHLPYALTRGAFRRLNGGELPGVFYIHPWELDPEQPRLSVPLLARLRHYQGLERTVPRLERLLGEFSFTSVADRFGLTNGRAEPRIDGPRFRVVGNDFTRF